MGPPYATVYWWLFLQAFCVLLVVSPVAVSVNGVWLFAQVLASSAVLRTYQAAEPVYLFVPDRVLIWICELPRPSSASTGDRISRISPIRSGSSVVSDNRYLPFPPIAAPPVVLPAAYRPSFMLRPSRVTLIVSIPSPLTVSNASPTGLVRRPGKVVSKSSTLLPTSGRFSILSCVNTSPTDAWDCFKTDSVEVVTSTV